MTVENCKTCGGTHIGSYECPMPVEKWKPTAVDIEAALYVSESYNPSLISLHHWRTLRMATEECMQLRTYIAMQNCFKDQPCDKAIRQNIFDLEAARTLHPKGNSVGDCVTVAGGNIRRLEQRISKACAELESMIDGGEECGGKDSQVSYIIQLLRGDN